MFFTRSLIYASAETGLIDFRFSSRKSVLKTFYSVRGSYWLTASINSLWWCWWVTMLVFMLVFIGHPISKMSMTRLCRRRWVCPILLVFVRRSYWLALIIESAQELSLSLLRVFFSVAIKYTVISFNLHTSLYISFSNLRHSEWE